MFSLLSKPAEHLFDSLGLSKLGQQVGQLMSGPRSPAAKLPHSPPPPRSVQKSGAEMKGSDVNDVRLLGINLTRQPRWMQLLLCTGGFFFGYITNGLAEEYVYNRAGFSYGWYFTFVQGFVYIGLILAQGFRPKHCVNPWSLYIKISAVLMFSTGLTKGSLAYLNYPAQIMFKSTKVLPVMLLGAVIPGLRRFYSLQEYVSALMLVFGLIIFTLADAASSPNFQMVGVVMVCVALLLDAILGNLQEAIFSVNPATTQTELLFCTTIVGMPFLLGPMIATGELVEAWSAGMAHPYVYGVVILEAFATYIGQLSVLSLIALFGAATTAMVTTLRKVFTLLLSYMIFTKPLLGQHCIGLFLISSGIGLKMSPDFLPTPSFMRPSKAVPAKAEIRYSPVDEERLEEGIDAEKGDKR